MKNNKIKDFIAIGMVNEINAVNTISAEDLKYYKRMKEFSDAMLDSYMNQ